MPEPPVLAVRFTVLPEGGEALTQALPSALMLETRPAAIDELVVPDPLQLVESP